MINEFSANQNSEGALVISVACTNTSIKSSFISLNTFKWALIFSVSLVFLLPVILSAQTIRSDSAIIVRVSTTIQTSITLETLANINFGRVSPGMTELYINPRTDNGAGILRVSGSPNSIIRVSFLERRELNRVGGGESLVFVYEVSGASEENQFISEPMRQENRQIVLSSTGEYYFWIGGRLDLAGISFGQYEGEFTLEIDYI
jgi:hypothetical protein